MSMILTVGGAFMQYALCAGAFALLCYGVYYFLRKRRERRDRAQLDFPEFLSDSPQFGDNASSSVKAEWIEFLPARSRK